MNDRINRKTMKTLETTSQDHHSTISIEPGRQVYIMGDDEQSSVKLAPKRIPEPDMLLQLFFGRAQA